MEKTKDPDMIKHERHWECYAAMKRWLQNRNEGKLISDYFEKYPYRTVAIYGAGDLGRLLLFELKDSGLKVEYFIDRSAEGRHEEQGIEIIMAHEIPSRERVDAIIVTPINDYSEVTSELSGMGCDIPAVSLRDIIYER